MKLFKLRTQKERFLTILLFCCSVVGILLLCEAVLQILLPSSYSNGYYIWPPHLRKVFRPYQDVMPGISGESEFIVNSHGVRGDELTPQHTYRILAIGGSTTECKYLDQSETWAYLLQETINENTNHSVWVGNAGMSGTTTRHHLTVLQFYPLGN